MNFNNDNLAADSYDIADSQEINSYEDYSTDLKFRSITVDNAPNQHEDFFFEPEGNSYHDMSADFSKQPMLVTSSNNSKIGMTPMIIGASSSSSTCPDVPFGIPSTHFKIDKSDYGDVVRTISEDLATKHPDHDFSFIEHEHTWKGKYLNGSSSFEVDVNLYCNRMDNNYMVGVRKIKSDCCLQSSGFRSFFESFKSALSTSDNLTSLSSSSSSSSCSSMSAAGARKRFVIPTNFKYTPAPSTTTTTSSSSGSSSSGSSSDGSSTSGSTAAFLLATSVSVSDAEFLGGIRPALKMALCCLENRIQSAKMLCDVSKKEARYLELPEFRTEALRVLEALIHDDSDEVRQYAVMAVAAFAELASYKEAFMQSCILPALFGLVENCTNMQLAYQMAQVRRTAAAVLATLCRTQPFTVRNELHKQDCDVYGWLQRVPCLIDQRTRESAMVCKQFLEDVQINGSSCGGSSSAVTTLEDCCTTTMGTEDFATLIHSA